jgi:hypothetical protein
MLVRRNLMFWQRRDFGPKEPVSTITRRKAIKKVETESKIRKVAFLGDYLPRKCGIATFTSDLLTSVAADHPEIQCFAVAVNDIEGGYKYPAVVRFEIEEQDLTSYQRAAGFSAGPREATCWRWCAN